MITRSMESTASLETNSKGIFIIKNLAVYTDDFKSSSPHQSPNGLIKSTDEIFVKPSIHKDKDQAIKSIKAKTRQRLK